LSGAAPRSVDARVGAIRRVGAAGTWIDLEMPGRFEAPRAGQFVQLACQPPGLFRLRRPFSICAWRLGPEGSTLGILFSVVGEGSRWLDQRKPGETVDVLGPLGRPFRPIPGRVPVLVAGGRGIAPLIFLADQAGEALPDGILLYGARDRSAIFPAEGCPYPVYRATLDGSIGHRGTVLDLLRDLLGHGAVRPEASALYACGPLPMLAALARIALDHAMPAQVSVETLFGCGTGICAGCAIPIRAEPALGEDPFGRYAFACSDGPVFEASRIDWEGVRE